MKDTKSNTICVYSPKGGTGKSGIVMALASVLNNIKKRTLLVDLDLFNGSLSLLIDENITKTVYQLTDDLNNHRYKTFENYVYKYNENIDILCAPKDPRQGNKIDTKYIDIIMEKAKENYEYVIFDTTNQINDINLVTMDSVDNILFVLTNDVMCLKNIRNILNIFKDSDVSNYKLLLNNAFYKNGYFSINDVKKIIGDNIDYELDNSFYIKEFNNMLFDNKIVLCDNGLYKKYKEVKKLEDYIKDIGKEGDSNEKE